MKVITKIKQLLKKKVSLEKKLIEKQTLYKEKKENFHRLVDKFNTGKYNKSTLNSIIVKLKDEMIELKSEIQKIKEQINFELLENEKELNKDILGIIKLML